MALNVSVESKENRQLTMTIQVPQERVEQELRKAARKVAGQYRVPGFRPGKAPYSVLVQYVGLPTLFNEFIEPLGEELYKQALEQEAIEPYAQAALDVSSLEPLTYELTIPLEPEIDLGDYRSLRVDATTPEISDEEVDAELDSLLEEQSEWTEVERPAQWGDTMVLDVHSVIVADASEEAGDAAEDGGGEAAGEEDTVVLDETEWEVTLDEENPLEPAGFDQELLGLAAGEEKEFVLEWPADSRSIYKGKKARFNVKVHKVQGHEAPALDDEFAQSIGPDFETLEDLKNHLRKTLEERKQAEAEDEFLTAALDKLVEQSTLVYPPVVIEDQIDSMVEEFGRQLRQYGIDGVETFLSRTGQSMDDYRESLREQAELTARRSLVISELYRAEGIEVSDEDIEERIQAMLGGVNPDGLAADLDEDDEEYPGLTEEEAAEFEAFQAQEAAAQDAETDDTPVEDAETGEAQLQAAESDEASEEASEEASDEEDGESQDAQMEAFRNLMLQGPGRQILESQILQQKALDRLRAIAKGEELPPVPEKAAPLAAGDEDGDEDVSAESPADAGAEEESASAESEGRS